MFNFKPNQKGQGLVEYALILVLVAVVVIVVLQVLGPLVSGVFTKVNSNLGGGAATDEGGNVAAPVAGCTDSTASNYDPNATQDDGSCIPTENISWSHPFPSSCPSDKTSCWTNTEMSGCIPGQSYTLSYAASTTWSSGQPGDYNSGATGSNVKTCGGGGSVWLGNFRPGQVVSVKNNSTGATSSSTVPIP